MLFETTLRKALILVCFSLLLNGLISIYPQLASANSSSPSNATGLPGRRESGGTRVKTTSAILAEHRLALEQTVLP